MTMGRILLRPRRKKREERQRRASKIVRSAALSREKADRARPSFFEPVYSSKPSWNGSADFGRERLDAITGRRSPRHDAILELVTLCWSPLARGSAHCKTSARYSAGSAC